MALKMVPSNPGIQCRRCLIGLNAKDNLVVFVEMVEMDDTAFRLVLVSIGVGLRSSRFDAGSERFIFAFVAQGRREV
jgi:hypothetical protein